MSFIVLEGIDGSGKSTQFVQLQAHLAQIGADFTCLRFPQYDKPSSALLTMYLQGEFGKNPEDVNAYAAATFYAVDRYASFKQVWKDDFFAGKHILTDRYTTSNAVHQGAKLSGSAQTDFFSWLDDFEHEKMELPRPNIVLYMDITLEVALKNVAKRKSETGQWDIHEVGDAYLQSCLNAAQNAADFFGWHKISCVENGEMRPPHEIFRDILAVLQTVL